MQQMTTEYDPAQLLGAKLIKAFGDQLWSLAVRRAVSFGQSKVLVDDIEHAGQEILFHHELSLELNDLLID